MSNQVKPSQTKSNQVKSSQIKSNQVESSQIKSNQVKSSQIKSNQVKSSQIKPNQVKSSEIKPYFLSQRKGLNLEESKSILPNKTKIKENQGQSSQTKSNQAKCRQRRNAIYKHDHETELAFFSIRKSLRIRRGSQISPRRRDEQRFQNLYRQSFQIGNRIGNILAFKRI